MNSLTTHYRRSQLIALPVCGLWKRDPAVLMSAMMLAIRALAGNEKLIC